MHLPQEAVAASARRVGIGESAVGGPGDRFRVTLGSCVGVCLVWPRRSRFAVAHVLLPSSRDGVEGDAPPSRFADSVVPHLLHMLGDPGRRRELVAYVAGGSTQFAVASSGASVGELNREALARSLAAHRIRVVASDLGGEVPRQLVVDGVDRQVISIRYAHDPECAVWDLPQSFGATTDQVQ